MVKAIKVPKKEANRIKDIINLNRRYYIKSEDNYVIFPVKDKVEGYEIIDYPLEERDKPYKDELKSLLTEEELKHLKTAYDIIGSIAILEIDEELEHKEKEIAEIIMKHNKSIKTILKKSGIHEGTFRTQKLAYIAGINTKETIHHENGVRLKLNVEEVYFSPRLSTERKRIFEQVKDNEDIYCMFSGCGPYPITLLRNSNPGYILSVEINPVGVRYQKENIKLNRISDEKIDVIEGDVRKIDINKKFDRIIMPLPKDAEDFLDTALKCSKKGTIIHLYGFEHEDNFERKKKEVIEKIKSLGYSAELKGFTKCGQYAPREHRVCYDIEIR